MRRPELIWFAIAAVLAATGFWPEPSPPSYEPAPRAQVDLRVVTWNLGGSGDGGHRMRDEWLPHVAEVLRGLDADIICVQELSRRRQALQLAKTLGDGWQMRVIRTEGRAQAVLYRDGDLAAPRSRRLPGAQFVVSQHPRRPPVMLVNIHADAYSASRRNQTIGEAIEILKRRPNDWPAILAGDLNLDVDLSKRRDLFTDNDYLDVETYNVVATDYIDAALNGGATAEPDRRLDYLFVDKHRFTVLAAGPIRNKRIEDMDHDPVVADLAIR